MKQSLHGLCSFAFPRLARVYKCNTPVWGFSANLVQNPVTASRQLIKFTSCFSFSRTVVRRGNLLTFLESGASTTTTIQSLATPVFLILPCQAKISSRSPCVKALHRISLFLWVPVCMYPGRLHPSRMCETQVGPPTLDVNINSVRLKILLSATCYHDALVVRHQKEQMCTRYKSVCLVGRSSWTTLCMKIQEDYLYLFHSIDSVGRPPTNPGSKAANTVWSPA